MFKKDYERTPQEKASRAKMSIIARLGGCGYLVYIMIQLLTTPASETPKSSWTTIVAIVLLVMAVVVIIITLVDLYRSFKSGLFNAATYEEEANFPCNPVEEESDDAETGALEAHDEDEADDADDDQDVDDDNDDGSDESDQVKKAE